MTEDERAYLSGAAGASSAPARPARAPGQLRPLELAYSSQRWRYGRDVPGVGAASTLSRLVCDHDPHDGELCAECLTIFEAVLSDVPALVADLLVALAREAVFVDQGAREQPPTPPEEDDPLFTGTYTEEAALPFGWGASIALARLRKVLGDRPERRAQELLRDWRATRRMPGVAELAGDLSAAVAYAHRIIDRPPTLLDYGTCPSCGEQIKQERVDPDDPDAAVACPCGYGSPVQLHFAAQLELGQDQHYTITELLRVLEQAGEPTTKNAITNLIYRRGLPREKGQRTRWRHGQLETHNPAVYRLGDVRAMLAERK